MLHPLGGRHAGASEAVGTTLTRFLGLVCLAVSLGLQTGHPGRTFGFDPPFQLGNPFLQPIYDPLLPDDQIPLLDDQGDQSILVGSLEVNFPFPSQLYDITIAVSASHPQTRFHQFSTTTLNSHERTKTIDNFRGVP